MAFDGVPPGPEADTRRRLELTPDDADDLATLLCCALALVALLLLLCTPGGGH